MDEQEFREYARSSGQVLCMESDMHVEWWIDEIHGCPWCKAIV